LPNLTLNSKTPALQTSTNVQTCFAMNKILLCCLASTILSALLTGHSVTQPEAGQVTVEELVRSTTSWDGTPLPAYPTTPPEITILRITIAPGTQLPMHKHPGINAGVVISGELTVFTDVGETIVLTAGDPIIEVVEKWHYGANTGESDVDIIVFYAGTEGTPLTVPKDAPEDASD